MERQKKSFISSTLYLLYPILFIVALYFLSPSSIAYADNDFNLVMILLPQAVILLMSVLFGFIIRAGRVDISVKIIGMTFALLITAVPLLYLFDLLPMLYIFQGKMYFDPLTWTIYCFWMIVMEILYLKK